MSHALLLRLFLSPSFFSVHVALRYLKTYSDNIGITYYITRRLRELDIHELSEVWGFICHLLVTRPSKSRALECFVVDIVQRSTHIAMITLWFMQASLRDLSLSRHDSQSFIVCQRTLHKCHEIIFGDLPSAAPFPYPTLFQSRLGRAKIKTNVQPTLVGLGIVLAGAPGMPKLVPIMGEVAIEQGRADDGHEYKSLQAHEDQVAPGIPAAIRNDLQDDEDSDSSEREVPVAMKNPVTQSYPSLETGDQLIADGSSSLFRRRTVGAARTAPALPLHLQPTHRTSQSHDPFGQSDAKLPLRLATSVQSSPSINSPMRSSTLGATELSLQKYDISTQSYLLRSHYCRSEIQFLLTLESVSNRLLVIPKPARVSALRAELTALNHKLPAEVCMPMWCSSSDSPQPSKIATEPHHRIVRIPPGESVVLNSAERAPYLLVIEILNDDLDFDPTRTANRELLKKIVAKEDERTGASRDFVPFNTPTTFHKKIIQPDQETDAEALLSEGNAEARDAPIVVHPPTPLTPPPPEEEEVDLVEQLYGTDISLRSRAIDLSESIVLPPAPKNKELDMAAWERSSPVPPTEDGSPPTPPPSLLPPASGPGRPSHHPKRSTSKPSGVTPFLSLDEYSERMRTAAIMLSQLNANLVREQVTPVSLPGVQTNSAEPDTASGTNWIPRSGWLPSGSTSSHRSTSGDGTDAHGGPTASAPFRMKLQHSEAAAIRDRIMKEMLALEDERMERMREGEGTSQFGDFMDGATTAEDEGIIRRELDKADPSAIVFSESWAAKKSRIQQSSPYGHLARWDCVSVIVKTGDLRQEQLAVQLIRELQNIWQEENCQCWVRFFRIHITGGTSGLVETITDAVSIHSIKKAQYARRMAEGRLGHVTLLDHFRATYGNPSSAKFTRAQRNFVKSLAGYSIVTFLLQIKDRHNGNILLDREGHLIHIDFGFMLSNSPGNIGFEAAPFKLSPEYIELLGGVDSQPFMEFRRLFREGFEAARKHCDRIITLVELMQKDSTLPCFAAFGEKTANMLRDRFQPTLTHSLVGEYVDRLIDSSLGSTWTRLYDSYQYYSQSIL